MRKVAYIEIIFDPNEKTKEFSLNLPVYTQILSCKRVIKDKKNFLQLCYSYYISNLEDKVINWKKYMFFIVSEDIGSFDVTGLNLITNINTTQFKFKVYYK